MINLALACLLMPASCDLIEVAPNANPAIYYVCPKNPKYRTNLKPWREGPNNTYIQFEHDLDITGEIQVTIVRLGCPRIRV